MKSDNIFVVELANQKPRFVIGDLSASKKTISDKAHTTIGTPCFIAPEVLASEKGGYTNKADGKELGECKFLANKLSTQCTPLE